MNSPRQPEVQYEIHFEKYDYFFTKRTNAHYDYITAPSIDYARNMAYRKHGDDIDILQIKVAD